MAFTIADLNSALATTLGAAASIVRTENYDQLSEGVNDTPTLQVYIESFSVDAGGGSTDRTTMRGGVRQWDFLFHADVYARQRSHLGEDMAKVVALADELIDILEGQTVKPYFGYAPIKSFSYRCERVTIEAAQHIYPGLRFYITLRVY